jgi:hypothetical protein
MTRKYVRDLSEDELKSLISRRLEEGWEMCEGPNGKSIIFPKDGDPKQFWCAEWITTSIGIVVPHWITVDGDGSERFE